MRIRELALGSQDIDENAVPAFVVKTLYCCFENAVVIQGSPRS
jgi:hypothetical protein